MVIGLSRFERNYNHLGARGCVEGPIILSHGIRQLNTALLRTVVRSRAALKSEEALKRGLPVCRSGGAVGAISSTLESRTAPASHACRPSVLLTRSLWFRMRENAGSDEGQNHRIRLDTAIGKRARLPVRAGQDCDRGKVWMPKQGKGLSTAAAVEALQGAVLCFQQPVNPVAKSCRRYPCECVLRKKRKAPP